MTRAKNELGRNEDFMQLYSRLESMFAHMQDPAASNALAFQKGTVLLWEVGIWLSTVMAAWEAEVGSQ